MDISVIIVSWNVKDKLKNNLQALLKSVNVNFEVFVVDNASTDNTVEMIKDDFTSIKLIANQQNLGFAKACNQAIKQASGRYILLLNPDMLVQANTLSAVQRWLDNNPQAAIAGIKLVDEAKNTIQQIRKFPQLFDQFLVASKIAHIFPGLLNSYLCHDFDYSQAKKVDSIRGSFFMIRCSTLEALGLLDESYFIWFEEVDYCRQAKEKNLEVWYTPVAMANDYVGQSFKQVDVKTKQVYVKASMLTYFKKWHPRWQIAVLKFGWFIGDAIVYFASKLYRSN